MRRHLLQRTINWVPNAPTIIQSKVSGLPHSTTTSKPILRTLEDHVFSEPVYEKHDAKTTVKP